MSAGTSSSWTRLLDSEGDELLKVGTGPLGPATLSCDDSRVLAAGDYVLDVAVDALGRPGGIGSYNLMHPEILDGESASAQVAMSVIDSAPMASTPEPATLSLLALGGLAMIRRRSI
jgi:hypothetical protein